MVIALTVLTFVAYTIMASRWSTTHSLSRVEAEPPRYIIAPLYLNPFFPLMAVLFGHEQQPKPHHYFPDWAISMGLFAALGLVAMLLALRNLKRAGEQL